MKAKLKDLRPNPFRNLAKYPVRKDRVEGMKQSILDTGYWKNILVRKVNSKIEMAYGHHRKAALIAIHGEEKEIDVIVDKMDDSMMLRRMANENDRAAELETDVADASVEAARKYLKAHPEELAKHLGDDHPHVGYIQRSISKNEIGRKPIARFLGGFWTPNRVRYVIERLIRYEKKDEVTGEPALEKKAVQKFGLAKHATTFQRAVHEIKHVPSKKQEKAAERIVNEEDFSRANMEKILLEEKGTTKKPTKKEKELIDFKEFLKSFDKKLCALFLDADRIIEIVSKNSIHGYEDEFNRLRDSCGILLYKIHKIFKGEKFDQKQIAEVCERKTD